MLKEWKNKRQLSLLVALALSAGGGQLFFNHAHAADVTGGDVYIDNTPAHPIPAVTPPAGGAIRSSSDNGDVHHNRLILDGVVYGANIYGGFTAGSGNADHNTLVFRNGAVTTATPYVIPAGGFSTAGNARYNTVIINGTGAAGSGMSVLGGYGGDGTKDLWTGNTLVVQRSGNQLRGVGFFQKVQFDLDNSIANGDTMLTIYVVWGNPVDWDKSSVTGVSDWIAHMRSQGINTPSLTLYTGAGVQLRNYAPTLMMNITDYEYGWRSNAAGTGTVIATGMTLDSSQFKGVTTPSVVSGITRGGYSVYGNTTQTNNVDINAGSHADVRAGYTNGLNGGSEHNTLNLTGGNVTNGYAGYTTGVHLLADPTSPTNPAAVDTSKNADAKNNTVNINGGTLNAGGKLYGGYIATNTALIPPDNVSAGNATGNIINIESGTFGGGNEIYGGYTNGTGEATGNTVNLGKSDGTFNAPTLSNVTLYGGGSSGSARDVVTGNTLNVNTNATAGNIKNFDKVSFNFNSSFNQANPMLNLVGGATSLNWNSITYTGTVPTGRSVLMQNMSTINFGTTYRAKEVPTTSDTHETVLDTNTGAGTAQQVFLDGNQFKSAAPTITTGSATEDVWAGRSVLGNTTTGNTLTLNGSTTHRDAYGGWTAGAGSTKAAKDSSTDNTVNLVNSTVRNIYGGFSSTASGNATDNKVNISGGTVSGTVHGGYLSHASATGDATGNIVTITGGSLGDAYGGFTSGTGKTTGNTVNLGDGSHVLASGTTINGVLYGGNQADVTGNTLNVKTNATARNIAKFDKVKFDINSTVSTANALLTLNNGVQTTGLKWDQLEVDTSSLTGAGITTYEPYRLKLIDNAAGIATTGYTGAKDSVTDKYEYIIDTDSHGANATRYITLEGYQFKDNTAATYAAADGTHTAAWAGRTKVGNKVENNKLTVTGGTINAAAYGGLVENHKLDAHGNPLPTGDAEKNTVAISGGTVANAYGAEVRTKDGNATENSAEITNGTVGSVYGATLTAANATGTADKSKVDISGSANITGDVYGGHIAQANATGTITNSEVNISGGTVNGSVYGGDNAGSGNATGGTLSISGGNVGGTIYGNHTNAGDATGATINITGGTMGDVYGGFANGTGKTTGNIVNLGTASDAVAGTTNISGTIYGGNQTNNVTGNTLNVYDSVSAGNIANFDQVNFKTTSSHITAGDTLLRLTGGTTTIDWNKLHVDDLDNTTASATEDRILTLMENANHINFGTSYSTTGTRGRIHTNDYEADIATEGNTATTTKVYLKGYRFQNNDTSYAGTTATDAWGGRSIIGNKVQKNKLTLTGGSATLNARGGMVENTERDSGGNYKTNGDATKNTLVLNSGAQTASAYGAEVKTKAGSATKNIVEMNDGTVHGNLYGAALTDAASTGNADANEMTINGGTVSGTVYGSHNAGAGDAKGNTITIKGGSLHGIYGGFAAGTGVTTGNTVNLGDGEHSLAAGTTINGTIYGGNKANDADNTLNVNTNATAGNIANFDKLKFTLKDSTLNPANSVLRLTTGATNNLDWTKLEVDATGLTVTPKSYEAYRVNLMDNANGVSFTKGATNTYASSGAKQRTNGDLEYVIDTDNHTANAAQYVYFEALQFQNKQNAAFAAADGTKNEAWGGRTKVGNEVKNNTLTVTGGMLTQAAYGGLAENFTRDSAGNLNPAGNATKNKLVLNAGANTLNAYGAQVRTKGGSAAENTVLLSGGTVTGSLYGGALTDAGATGSATANEITVKGGTVTGDVYGGFTNGSGNTTGNTVNLGDGEHSLPTGTNIAGTIYGGNKADVTGNTLNVNTNAAAGNIQNFGKLQFNLNSSALTQSTPMLRLSASGGTNNLDWRTLDVNAEKFNAPIKTYEAYNLVLMENTNGISFQQGATNTYTVGGGVKSTTSGDFEFTIDTANSSVSSTQVTAAGYKFKNHDASYNEVTPHTEAWAGRTNIGNTVKDNTLTVMGGSLTTAAYGGLVINNKLGATTGDAENNKIVVNGTANVADAYGAQVRTKDGNATENTAEITGGSVTNVYGAALTAAGATGKIEKSKVNISGNIGGSVYGGQIRDTAATGSITGSTITLTHGSIGGSVYGGDNAGTGAAKDNVLNLYGGSVTGNVYGGRTASGAATGNTVNLGDGTTNAVTAVTGVIHGGNQADVTGNTLNVKINATAGNIHNFETVKFHLNSTINPANSLLTLNNGAQTTGLKWDKLDVDTSSLTGAGIKTYEPYKLNLIDNAAHIATAGYTGAKDHSTDKFEYVINTDNNTATADRYVTLEGYQFKDNSAATYTAADGTQTEAWAGRTKVGHTVENNTLKVTGGMINTAAYGGVVENNKIDAHGNPLQTGDATKNKLILEGGTIQNGYGADVRTQAGNATGNVIDLKGATISGRLYGGALTNTAASGSATGNTVNILSGSVGDVYGGFANGTGATTGNTVNLGTATDAVAAGTTVGTIWGGNKNVTGNTLNVNSRNAGATDVKNFENVNFDVAHNVSHGDTMLTLTNGAGTSIDWSKMQLKNLDTITASPTSDHILTLLDSANDITFTNYDAARARETKKDGDYEYVLNTEHETDSDKKVNVTGYRFANNHPTYSAGTAPEAWGGRSKVGNTVTKNSLDVTGGTITKAIGGIAQNLEAGDGVDGYKKTGDAAENTLTLNSGATITDGYGADVRTEAGNATGNIIDMKGANVTGNLYGGALTHASASGSATGNTVNLYSGSVAGDVYGGFANGNGKTTGNTITIGDGTNDANVTVTGKLSGGNKSAEGNVLNLKSKGAQVGSLENFGKITWSLGSNLTDGDTVLTLNDDTALTYSTIEKPAGADVSNWLGSVMEKNVHLFQMAAGKTLTLNGYSSTGSERTGDVEYSLVTDNNQAVTTAGGSLDLTAYKWQNANVDVNSNARSDVFGGKTVYGTDGATKNNKLTLKTGAAVTNAIAGDTQTASGTAEENILTVEDGTATNAYGAKTVGGKATKNKAILTGGSVTDKLVAAQSQSGTAEENHVEVKGGSVTNAIGAETLTAGDAANNKAIISSGTVTGSLKGAQSAGKAVKNTVDIKGGDISGASVIGAQASGNAEENTVTISAAPTSNTSTTITGGHSTHGNAVKNVVNVNAAVTGNIVGGSTDSTNGLDAIDNTVNVHANVTGDVYGGHARNASKNNTVNIADGITVTGSVFGGSCIIAEGNIVNIGKGSTVTGDVAAGNATGSNRDNIINLTGSRVEGTIKGGNGGATDSNNTLAVHHDLTQQSYAGDFTGIKNLQFYLNEGITNENPTILNLGVTNKDIRGIDVGVGVNGTARNVNLRVNDVISLMKVNGGTLTTDADSAVPPAPTTLVNHVETMQGVSLLYGFDIMKRSSNELIATVTKAAINEQAKSFVETRAAATSFINGGADLLAGAGMTSAKKEGSGDKDKDARGYHLWAAMEQSGMTAKTGSYADTQGYGLAVGWTRELGQTGSTLLFSPFVEYGKGKYDSYLDDGTHGSGNISYLGLGIMGRVENTQGLWAEAALHGGKTRSDYSGSIYADTNSRYDSSNAYYAAHLGIGKEMKTSEKDKVNTYLRYFWSYQSGMQAKISTSGRSASVDEYSFGAVNSNRVRLGFRYTHKDSDKSEIFAGLAWEYELSGKATASYMGYETPSPSLRGGSGMLEVGYRFAPKDSRFSYDLRFAGWQGKRQGYSGGAHVNWAF